MKTVNESPNLPFSIVQEKLAPAPSSEICRDQEHKLLSILLHLVQVLAIVG